MFSFIKKKKLIDLEARLNNEIDVTRCRIDLDPAIVDEFDIVRYSSSYQSVFKKDQPLVTVCVATYNRAKLLTTRTLPSILNQTYRNIEIIVVGDNCTDSTQEDVLSLNDNRIKFINLDERGKYPKNKNDRWRVAGTKPINHALEIAKGDFITHLDDDDRYPEDRIEKLLAFAQQNEADIVWHPFYREKSNNRWKLMPASEFIAGSVTTSSVFYHNWFKCIGWDINAWRFKEPGDWNRFRKFKYLGANTHFYPEPMLYHYKEQNNG